MNATLRISAVVAMLVLAACGNKGPLVMPQKPVPVEEVVPATPPVEPAPAQEASDDVDNPDAVTDDGDG